MKGKLDWYEAYARIGGELEKVHTLVTASFSMAGGGSVAIAAIRVRRNKHFSKRRMHAFEFASGGVFRPHALRQPAHSPVTKILTWLSTRADGAVYFVAFRFRHWSIRLGVL